MPAITDDARVQDALRLNYQTSTMPELVFDKKCDPLMLMMEDVQDNSNPGAGFVVQMAIRGGVNANPMWSYAGTEAEGYKKITLPAVDLNWRAKWTRNAMIDAEAAKTKGVYNFVKQKIDREIRYTWDSMSKSLEGNGWGTLCKVASNSGSTFVVGTASGVPVPSMVNRFFKGQKLCAAANEASGDQKGANVGGAGNVGTVVDIDRATGTVTLDQAVVATLSWANGDAISEKGFRPYSASSGKRCFNGLDYWLPTAAITDVADPRYQIEELQPLRFPTSGQTITDVLLEADEFWFTAGLPIGDNPVYLCSPAHYRQLIAKATKEQITSINSNHKGRDAEGKEYVLSYQGYKFQGQRGITPVVPSRYVTPGRIYFGDFSDPVMGFKLAYSGDALININQRDSRIFRMNAENGVTDNSGVAQSGFSAEGFSRAQVLCRHPGNFGIITGVEF